MKLGIAALTFLAIFKSASSEAAEPRLGIVIIDVQRSFVANSATENMPAVLGHIKNAFQLAEKNQTPFFITYEAKKTGDGALPADLKRLLPRQAQEFIKSTFAATGQAQFASALRNSGLSHIAVFGAETDVCVLQTALGLRMMGFQVLLAKEGVFSSEPNTSPALARLAAAGVTLASSDDILRALDNGPLPQPVPEGGNSIVEPFRNGELNVALVLNGFDEESIQRSNDAFRREKLERLRELLLLSEWMELPVYISGASAAGYSLPPSLLAIVKPEARSYLERKQWLPIEELPARTYRQVFVAGAASGLQELMNTIGNSRQVFSAADALLAMPGQTLASLAGIPFTYKTFYYDLLKSINPQEWPSRSWRQRDATFESLMEAPESLSQIRPRE